MFRLLENTLGMGFIGLLALALTPAFAPMLSKWEGEILPVIRDVSLYDIRPDMDGTYFKTSFDKVRDCEFIGLVWYRNDGSGVSERVPIRFPVEEGDQSDRSRAEGKQRTGEWFLRMRSDELKDSFAEVRHRCHILWTTKTQFYP